MTSAIKAGDRYVWEPDALTPPAIFVKVKQVRQHGTRVLTECRQGNRRWTHRFSMPLPPTMTRRNWNHDEIGAL